MRLVRAGDERAFEAIFDRHHRGILSFCRHMVTSREEAEDAVQHTFAAAYRDMVTSDKPIQLKAWLYTIARNRCLSILRARKEQVSIEDAEPATEGLSSEVQRRQDLRDMLVDLHKLPEDQRAALVLSELGALTHDEIGVTLGVRKDKVKALVFQARESLASSRQARDADCREIQEQLSVLSGGALRRSTLRRHVEICPACAAFKAEVKRQRSAMAVLLPVAPSALLRDSALAAIFGGGAAGGGGMLIGGGGAGGLLAATGAKGLAAKVMAIAAVAGGATGGGLVAVDEMSSSPGGGGGEALAAAPDESRSVKLVTALRHRARRAAVQRKRDYAAAAATPDRDTEGREPDRPDRPDKTTHARAPREEPASTGPRMTPIVETSTPADTKSKADEPKEQPTTSTPAPPPPPPAPPTQVAAAPPQIDDAESDDDDDESGNPGKGRKRKRGKGRKRGWDKKAQLEARKPEKPKKDKEQHPPQQATPPPPPPPPTKDDDDSDDDDDRGKWKGKHDGGKPGHGGDDSDDDHDNLLTIIEPAEPMITRDESS